MPTTDNAKGARGAAGSNFRVNRTRDVSGCKRLSWEKSNHRKVQEHLYRSKENVDGGGGGAQAFQRKLTTPHP